LLSISDDFIRRSGIPLRWSAWRKPQALTGIEAQLPACNNITQCSAAQRSAAMSQPAAGDEQDNNMGNKTCRTVA
jgi:hypothetical protein